MVYEIIEIILWYMAVVVVFIMMIIFFIESRKRDFYTKIFFQGLGTFSLAYGVARLIENVRRYSIGSYNDIFEAWVAGEQIAGLNFWLRLLYYIIAWIGIAIFYFNIEHSIFKKNKYILTILSIFNGFVSIINYLYLNMITFSLAAILYFIPTTFLSILFINLARKSPPGGMRNSCIMIAVGVIIFIFAVMIDLPETAYLNHIYGIPSPILLYRILSPILVILGLSLFSYGFMRFFVREAISSKNKTSIEKENPKDSRDFKHADKPYDEITSMQLDVDILEERIDEFLIENKQKKSKKK